MNRYHSYINTAAKLIGLYQKGEPLHLQLKKYYAANKKMGSRDRKLVTDLCYAYFRLKPLMPESIELQEKILMAAFICGKESLIIASSLRPEWLPIIGMSATDKLKFFHLPKPDHYPFYHQISASIHQYAFAESLLYQPRVFLRVRSGHFYAVKDKLNERGVPFTQVSENILAVDQGVKLDQYLKLNKEAVIQDLSSSRVFDSSISEINLWAGQGDGVLQVWDVCAASGGKSILFHDLFKGKIKLTVSDIRESILVNLTQRLAEAGVNLYRKFTADMTADIPLGSDERFDVVICDVPCSGSGTWARTPEQFAFYEDVAINRFAELQKKITLNAARFLKDNGWLIYITCSVFEIENEKNVQQICEEGQLKCVHENYLKGYDKAADSLYCAVLRKSVIPS